MKTFLSSLAVAFFATSSALAGITYDFSSVSTGASNATITGSVKAEGSSIRVDIDRGDGVLFANGSYVVSTDGGKTMNVVNPAEKNFYVLNFDEIVGGANSLLKNLGGDIKLDVRNPKVSVTGGGDGGKIEGYDTKKSTVATSYEIAVDAFNRKMSMTMQLSTDVWWTDKLSAEFTNFLQMQGMRTGFDAVDKMLDAERGAIKGFPMKQVTTTKLSFNGSDMTSSATSNVTNVKKAAIPATAFAVPKDFARTQSPLEKMMSGLAPR